jgi:hypothetical protein
MAMIAQGTHRWVHMNTIHVTNDRCTRINFQVCKKLEWPNSWKQDSKFATQVQVWKSMHTKVTICFCKLQRSLQFAFADCNDRCNLLLQIATIVAICFCKLQRPNKRKINIQKLQTAKAYCNDRCNLQKQIATSVAICKSKLQRSLQFAKAKMQLFPPSIFELDTFGPLGFLTWNLFMQMIFMTWNVRVDQLSDFT